MKSDTLLALEKLFNEFPFLMAGPVPKREIESVLEQVEFDLPADYLEFVQKFGGAIPGPYPIYGLRRAEEMSDDEDSALRVTKFYRDQHWPGVEHWLVISTDHAGNPVGIAKDGCVRISDHDFGRIDVLADSFEEYLRNFCLELDPR